MRNFITPYLTYLRGTWLGLGFVYTIVVQKCFLLLTKADLTADSNKKKQNIT